ncbi:MAG: AhpC/TSA family protein [Porphyromonadaceae bacterium]|nr:MAG: AhpC/TSA family protein [Porphyromonadaceae bacterium]
MDLKTIRIFAAGLLVIAGCAQQADFTINGKLKGAIKDSLVLEEMTEKSLEMRSSMITGADGSFNYSDTAGSPRLFFIRTHQNEYITLIVLSGEKITITAEKGRINETLRISGSPQSELVMELNRELIKATVKLDSLGKQYQELKGHGNDPQVDTWVQGEYGKLIEQQRSFIRAFIERHVAEPASLLALSHQIGKQSVLNGSADFDLFKKVDAQLYKKYPKSILILNLHKYVEAMRPQMESVQSNEKTTGSGSVAPDISLPDPDGKTQTLSSLRGKIVLLDFWAGWCGPCRRENPNLVTAYAKYHDKGFEIFQVSLDKTKPEWLAAIRQDGLNWIHVSDLKFWNSPVARLYGIESIPANFLLDKEGKIIGSNLRGAALKEELAKLFR